MTKKKKKKSTFLKKPLESIAVHIGKLADRLSGKDLMQIAGFAGLAYTYWLWEKDDPDGKPRPLQLSVPVTLAQAGFDLMLLNSRTEIGVGTAVGHLAGRGAVEWLEGIKWPAVGYPDPSQDPPGAAAARAAEQEEAWKILEPDPEFTSTYPLGFPAGYRVPISP